MYEQTGDQPHHSRLAHCGPARPLHAHTEQTITTGAVRTSAPLQATLTPSALEASWATLSMAAAHGGVLEPHVDLVAQPH